MQLYFRPGCAFMRGSDWDVLFGSSYAAVNRSVIKAAPAYGPDGGGSGLLSVFTAQLLSSWITEPLQKIHKQARKCGF